MPPPFPGMDQYLEDPVIFPELHDRMITHLSEALQARLPEPYFAVGRSLIWVETSERSIEPNGSVLPPADEALVAWSAGCVAVASTPARPQPVVVHVPHDERRHTWVEVRLRREERERVVTVQAGRRARASAFLTAKRLDSKAQGRAAHPGDKPRVK